MTTHMHSMTPRPATSPGPVVVLGGGPAGSTAANLLAQHGREVLLLEKEPGPRFHVGESLLVYTRDYWDRLGLTDALEDLGFQRKYGGELRIGVSPDRTRVLRSKMLFSKVPQGVHRETQHSFQVERSRFDAWLLERAEASGARVVRGARVDEVSDEARPLVRWTDGAGNVQRTRASFVVDASGRRALMSRKLGLFQPEQAYNTSAIFGHFEGVSREAGRDGGSINVYLLQHGWVWFIPFADGRMSVGIVMTREGAKHWSRSPDETLRDIVGRYAYLRDRFEGARQVGKTRILRNLPYASSQFVGRGWALCGDAAFFVDPIQSSGVHLAFSSGTKVADAVHAHLGGDRGALEAYEETLGSHYRSVREHVSLFYEATRFYPMMRSMVRLTGPWSGHWGGPWLKRVAAWSYGLYGDYAGSMRLFWALARVGIRLFGALYALTGRDPWGRHGLAAPPTDFQIPFEPPVTPPKAKSA